MSSIEPWRLVTREAVERILLVDCGSIGGGEDSTCRSIEL